MIPDGARPRLYLLAPFIALFCAIGAFGLMPFGGLATVPGTDIQFHLYMADSNVALLFVAALGSLGFYGLLIGGWASGSKYSLLGGMRAIAQLVSYEVAFTLAVIGVVIHSGSLSFIEIAQEQSNWVWYIVPQFLGFLVFMVAAVAESNRPPFDLAEADGEVVAGYHTEYGGMRFAMFANAEFINAITLSALGVRAVPGRAERTGAARADLDAAEDRLLPLHLHLAARHRAPRAVRPADVAGLEGAAAGRHPQPPRHRVLRGLRIGRPRMLDQVKGFSVTLRHLFRKPVDAAYPEYKRPVYPRFRGRHQLHRHENGLEKCVGCSLCAAACPSDCIRVVAAENTVDNRVSAGERYARIYEINMARCIFCGYCELACPFDAITLGNDFELSEISREALVYTKEMLLEKPLRRTPSKAVEEFDHPVQEMERVLGMYEIVTATNPEGTPATTKSRGSGSGNGRLVRRLRRRDRAAPSRSILQRNPFISAIALLGNLASLATLYMLLQSDFVAAAQIIVYAGAVMVMFLFVIAYIGPRGELRRHDTAGRGRSWSAASRRVRSWSSWRSWSAGAGVRQPAVGRGRSSARRRTVGELLPDDLRGRVRARLAAAAGGGHRRASCSAPARARCASTVRGERRAPRAARRASWPRAGAAASDPGPRLLPRRLRRCCSRSASPACCCAASRWWCCCRSR